MFRTYSCATIWFLRAVKTKDSRIILVTISRAFISFSGPKIREGQSKDRKTVEDDICLLFFLVFILWMGGVGWGGGVGKY